jgi:hypothetical protein
LLGGVGKDIGCDLIHKVQEGLESRGNLGTASGDLRSGKTVAMHDELLWYTFVTTCSDLWAIHQRKCKNGKKEVSIVA